MLARTRERGSDERIEGKRTRTGRQARSKQPDNKTKHGTTYLRRVIKQKQQSSLFTPVYYAEIKPAASKHE